MGAGAAGSELGAKGLAQLAANTGKNVDNIDEVIRSIEGVKSAANVMDAMHVVGKATGVVDAGLGIKEAFDDPTLGNWTKAGVKIALVFIKTNPITSLALAAADLSGLTDWLFDW